ncbi:MAG: dihydroorotate dehydrogenase electron transfer subunit [Clostridia bacterium]|nr:dihydroorotate dehydrogenase electron transfer subunit [Clostridia bacterium]
MKLRGDTSDFGNPGQFVNIALEGRYLRRPISVCDYNANEFTIIYKVVGEGTRQMSTMTAGQKLNVLTGLGNGYTLTDAKAPLLVGGGVGVPPLYGLARRITAQQIRPTVVLGFNSARDVFFENEFRRLGCNVFIATVDGTAGFKGMVTDCIKKSGINYDYVYTCGPEPMLKALYDCTGEIGGQFSFEERMGCGFGACMGCTCETKYGNKRICTDGPVLLKEEIIW